MNYEASEFYGSRYEKCKQNHKQENEMEGK